MKKAVSVLLSAIIILCSLTCMLIMPASAATNLWMGLSTDDWYTKQMSANVGDYTQLVEQKMTEKYPTDFSESEDVFTLKNAYNKFYYIKMPALSKNKDYTVSFHYDVTLYDQGEAPLLKQVYLIPESALGHQHMFHPNNGNLTGQAYSGRSFLGVYEPVSNLALTAENASDAFTYTFNTKTHTQYYLYINFGYINQVSFSDFTVFDSSADAQDNLWKAVTWRSDSSAVSFKTANDATEGEVVEVVNPSSVNMYSRLPKLEAGKKYQLSLKYKSILPDDPNSPTGKRSGEIGYIKLATKSAFETKANWNDWGTGKRLAENKTDVTDIESGIALTSDIWVDYSYVFETGTNEEFYFYLRTGYTWKFYMTDFDLREVKESFISQPVFYNTNGRVTAPNHYAKLTTKVNGTEVSKIKVGDEVTATVDYDTASKAYKFYGWVNKAGDVVSEETTFTFTASEAECYEPWIIEKNAVDSASFENLTDGTSLQVAVDTTNKKADAPSGELWGFGKNAGYYGVTTATEVTGANGTVYTPKARNEWGTKDGALTVSDERAHSGSNSIKVNVGGWYALRALKVTPKTNYTISYWHYSADSSNLVNISSVTTTYNWGKAHTAPPTYVSGGQTLNLSVKNDGMQNDVYHNPKFVTMVGKGVKDTASFGTWKQVTFDFNSGNFETLYLLIQGSGTVYIDDIVLLNKDNTDFALFPSIEPIVNDDNLGTITPTSVTKEAGKIAEFTASYFKGNSFKGWYNSNDQLITKELILTYEIPADYASPKAVFEAGEPAVENAGMENSSDGYLAHYKEDGTDPETGKKIFTKQVVDPLWDIEFPGGAAWAANIQAKSTMSHNGSMAVRLQTQNNYAGRHFTGLEKNTDYAISFWAYIDNRTTYTLSAYVAPKGTLPYTETVNGKGETIYPQLTAAEALGVSENPATALSKWQEVVVNFNSGDNTEVTLWMLSRNDNEGTYLVWVDDFAIYHPATFYAYADLGGTVSASATGSVVKGSEVTATATPDAGNTFKHWVDETGAVYSTDATATITAIGDKSLRAVFDGYNKNARELFAYNGQDGTFENGSIVGWYGDHVEYGKDKSTFCKWTVTDKQQYQGNKSLEVTSYYRSSVLPLTGLSPDTNYRFSFYFKYPYPDPGEDWRNISDFGIVGKNDIDIANAGTVYTSNDELIATDSGWWKADLYFNTGDATAVNFVFYYSGEYSHKPTPVVYFDNVELWEYYTNAELTNGDAEDGTAPWLGDAVDATDGSNKVFSLPETMDTMYQTFAVEQHSEYTISFKAKGQVLGAATEIYATLPEFDNIITSQSYTASDSDDWNSYSFQVYTGVRTDLRLIFTALADGVLLDDITVTKENNPVGAVIDYIDFESSRFALAQSDSTVYEWYLAQDENDPNVHSGYGSLHFKHSTAVEDVTAVLEEAFLTYGVAAKKNYRITMYYKADRGNTIYLAPNYQAFSFQGWTGSYVGELGGEHAGTGKWEKLEFTFTADNTGFLKVAISNIIGKTNGDFYLDDITIALGPDLVTDPNTEKAYCSQFYSVIKNGGFEQKITDDNWKDLPSSAKVIKDPKNADTADHFLRIQAGTKYVLPITLEPGEVYYFGASYKASKGGKGTISLVTMVDPAMIYFLDQNNKDASIITVDNSDKWERSAFGFRANSSGTTYLVIECTSGTIDIDSVSLCKEKFTHTEDPNRYYERIPFDYNNIDPSMIVYNGGVDEIADQLGESPETGETIFVVAMVTILGLLAGLTVVLCRKRKEKANV